MAHAIQINTIGTSSLAMIPCVSHFLGHSHCSHCPFMKAPHAVPGARSICMNDKSVGWGFEFVKHTQTIPALNRVVPPSNI